MFATTKDGCLDAWDLTARHTSPVLSLKVAVVVVVVVVGEVVVGEVVEVEVVVVELVVIVLGLLWWLM